MSGPRPATEAKAPYTMSSQKRLLLFFALSFVMVYGTQALMERMGLLPPPRSPPPRAAANAEAAKPAVAQADAGPAPKPAAPVTRCPDDDR